MAGYAIVRSIQDRKDRTDATQTPAAIPVPMPPQAQPIQPVVIQVPTPAPTPAPQLDEDYIVNLIQRVFPKPTPVEAPVPVQPVEAPIADPLPAPAPTPAPTPAVSTVPVPTPVPVSTDPKCARVTGSCWEMGGKTYTKVDLYNEEGRFLTGSFSQGGGGLCSQEWIEKEVNRVLSNFMMFTAPSDRYKRPWTAVEVKKCDGDYCHEKQLCF